MLDALLNLTGFKGAGGPQPGDGQIRVSVVSNRRGPQLPDGFYQIKNYCSYPKLSHFEIVKIQVITVCVQILIAISRKWPILEFYDLLKPEFNFGNSDFSQQSFLKSNIF